MVTRLAAGVPYERPPSTDSQAVSSLQDQDADDCSPSPPPSASVDGQFFGDETDDFAIMHEHQAKRIQSALKLVYDVELSVEMILAHTNASAITRRVREWRRLVEEVGTNTASG